MSGEEFLYVKGLASGRELGQKEGYKRGHNKGYFEGYNLAAKDLGVVSLVQKVRYVFKELELPQEVRTAVAEEIAKKEEINLPFIDYRSQPDLGEYVLREIEKKAGSLTITKDIVTEDQEKTNLITKILTKLGIYKP